jgi:acetyltransferase-like isoleucine patch superfamily enzyme
MDDYVRRYENVTTGEGLILYPPVILGMPPRGRRDGDLPLRIGRNATVRPFTTIYAGSEIGDRFQTGQGVSIREDNRIGHDVSVGTGTVLEIGNRIGDHVRIHTGCFLERVEIEEHCFIGPRVVFTDDPHPPCPKYGDCVGGPRVMAFARIGANCTLLPGVTIGRNSLVGAGSVVVRDVPENTVVAGSPARVIKRIDELRCTAGHFERPYTWPPNDPDNAT